MKWLIVIPVVSALLAGCSDEAVLRSDVPLTRATASSKMNVPLPASAHDIYFLVFGGGLQDLESYTRMDVDQKELDAAVDALIADNNKTLSRSLAYPKRPLSSSTLMPPRKDFLPMPWWNPASVTKGYFRGEMKSYALQIVVDEDRSRIYIYQND